MCVSELEATEKAGFVSRERADFVVKSYHLFEGRTGHNAKRCCQKRFRIPHIRAKAKIRGFSSVDLNRNQFSRMKGLLQLCYDSPIRPDIRNQPTNGCPRNLASSQMPLRCDIESSSTNDQVIDYESVVCRP